MRSVALLALPLMAGMAIPAHSAQWASTTACTVVSPGEAPRFFVVAVKRTNSQGEVTTSLHVRIDSSSPLLEDGERLRDASIDVPGQGQFTDLDARGTAPGKIHRVTVNVSDEGAILRALTRGSSVNITLPASAGQQDLTFSLDGSAAAALNLAPCIN